jgi:excisionase family DNA binding protein
MKLDLELARQILEQVEEKSNGQRPVHLVISGYRTEEISDHVRQLHRAGLLEATDRSTSERECYWVAVDLTGEGYEFLDAIRNNTVWNKLKETVKEKGGSTSFEVVKGWALRYRAKRESEAEAPTDPIQMTITEAAKYVGVSDRTIRDWRANGKLKVHQDDHGHLVFSKSTLEMLRASR